MSASASGLRVRVSEGRSTQVAPGGTFVDARIVEGTRTQIIAKWPGDLLDKAGELRRLVDLSDTAAVHALIQDLDSARESGDWSELIHRTAAMISSAGSSQHSGNGSHPAADSSVSRLHTKQSNRENQDNLEFRLTPLQDFLAEDPEIVSYALDNTLPLAGLSILGAKPKTGKTTFARNLALSQARGEAVLGRRTTRGPVVYLALEEKRGELQRQFKAMGATDEPILIHTGAAPVKSTEALRSLIEECVPVLVIVDPLQDFAKIRDINDYSVVHSYLAPIRDVARETGAHIMLLHHNNKADDLLGSTQLFGTVDTLLLMARRDDTRTIRSVQRYGEDIAETALTLDKETGIIAPSGDYREMQVEHVALTVLEAMGADELTEADIRERVGGNESLTAKAIRHLLASGRLRRSGAGKRGDPYIYSVSRLALNQSNRESDTHEEAS